jgi:hypothetical protein
MTKYFLAAAILIVAVLGGYLLWQRNRVTPHSSICADDVRGYQESVESSLAASAKGLNRIEVGLKGTTSKTFIDQLAQIKPSDLLALKTCDTQCKLLERCLGINPRASVDSACATEYKDYKARVDGALGVVSKVQEYERLTKQAAEQADALSKTQEQLHVAPNGVGSIGGREEVLKRQVANQTQGLISQVAAIDNLAKEIVGVDAKK